MCVLDGWGDAPDGPGNAVAQALTPAMDRLFNRYPHTLLDASGLSVGLPAGQQGNSEVGHLTIGAGRVVLQDLTRIDAALADGSFFENPVLVRALQDCLRRGSSLHVMGLMSPGGVHSHQDHLLAVCELAQRMGLLRVNVHAFTDGRDTPPTAGAGYLQEVQDRLASLVGRIASVSGRYFAMDRDQRWDRVQLAYQVLLGSGRAAVPNPIAYLRDSYAEGTTDEFIVPTSVVGPDGQGGGIRPGDVIVHCNFRPDRARELCHTLVDPNFSGFDRGPALADLELVTFTKFDDALPVAIAFPKPLVRETVGAVVGGAGLAQFHVAETEKYAHVTYFIDGGQEEPLPGEERLLVPSQRVATYDLCPEMSAQGITNAVLGAMERGDAALIVVNYANADMVGHTGKLAATIKAVEFLDACVDRVARLAEKVGYLLLITADHGNAEQMLADDGRTPLTSHTSNQVPLLLTEERMRLQGGGGLCDVAPTLLEAMGLPIPVQMTGRSLLVSP
ncbi:MAG TPA: 2,3-bisphosphoglycerate-independent phosphoglycerate mutase [Candidatus Dormibacteraeota bacterium]|nr:2,3-bisphosphoglycerate-independent phosphoglycerate mutase [Candidatus Dormibacteraeota bacterium]